MRPFVNAIAAQQWPRSCTRTCSCVKFMFQGVEFHDTFLSRVREETPGRDIYKAREGQGWGEKSRDKSERERKKRERQRQAEAVSKL